MECTHLVISNMIFSGRNRVEYTHLTLLYESELLTTWIRRCEEKSPKLFLESSIRDIGFPQAI